MGLLLASQISQQQIRVAIRATNLYLISETATPYDMQLGLHGVYHSKMARHFHYMANILRRNPVS
jgi:hypothetical protein